MKPLPRSLKELKVTALIAKMGPIWKELDPEKKKVCMQLAVLCNCNSQFQLQRTRRGLSLLRHV